MYDAPGAFTELKQFPHVLRGSIHECPTLPHDRRRTRSGRAFSHAVEQDGWVFLTGQMPFTGTANDSPYPEGIEAQTRQVLGNLQRVLAGCGLGLEHVLAVRIFLTHFEDDYDKMNHVYAEHFPPERRPARTCVGVTALARGARIEIDMMARRP